MLEDTLVRHFTDVGLLNHGSSYNHLAKSLNICVVIKVNAANSGDTILVKVGEF
jgi:hypothetical protein